MNKLKKDILFSISFDLSSTTELLLYNIKYRPVGASPYSIFL